MHDSHVTRASLLIRLRDPQDDRAWSQFVDLYGPLIYAFGRQQGLQDADAADLLQDVLRSVARAIGRFEYDQRTGSFRGWLFTIARNRCRDFLAERARRHPAAGGSAVQNLLLEHPAPEDEQSWNDEYERRLFDWAARQVRQEVEETTWQAFWQTAVDGHSPQAVADRCGISIAAVYLAKSRVMRRLKNKILMIEEKQSAGDVARKDRASS
ncbi:MAG: RNA polymerase sigma factor [Planctomycetales bacterium]